MDDTKGNYGQLMKMTENSLVLGVLYVLENVGVLKQIALFNGNQFTLSQLLQNNNSLSERFVREALLCLVGAELLQYHSNNTFSISKGWQNVLCDEKSPFYGGGWIYAIQAQMAALPYIVDAFKTGVGVEYKKYGPGMVIGIDKASSPGIKTMFIRKWLTPGLPDLVKYINSVNENQNIYIADVGCGGGESTIQLATFFKNAKVIGYDIDATSIELAKKKSSQFNLKNIEFLVGSTNDLPKQKFDLIVSFDVIHDLSNPIPFLKGISAALKPNGISQYFFAEPAAFDTPEENLQNLPSPAFSYGMSTLYCLQMSMGNPNSNSNSNNNTNSNHHHHHHATNSTVAAGIGTCGLGNKKLTSLLTQAGFSSFKHLDQIKNPLNAFYSATVANTNNNINSKL